MTQLLDWGSALPAVALILAVLTLPGLLVAAGLRFRRLDALGLAPGLSIGILGVAVLVNSVFGLPWGLPLLAATTLFTAGVTTGLAALARHLWPRQAPLPPAAPTSDPTLLARYGTGIRIGLIVAAALVGMVAVAAGIGAPATLNQTYDSVFHVSSIDRVARHASIDPRLLGGLTHPTGFGGFYPPIFAALGGLLTLELGIHPVSAGNVTAAAMVGVWPLSLSPLVRTVTRRLSGFATAMAATVLIPLFPGLLLSFGVLWANIVGLLALPAMLVLGLRVLRIDASRLPWPSALVGGGLVVIGIGLGHPGAAFTAVVLMLPMLSTALWRMKRRVTGGTRGQKLMAAAITAGTLAVLVVLWLWTYRVPVIQTMRGRVWWDVRQTVPEGILEIIMLDTPDTPAAIGFGLLAIIGAVVLVRRRRHRWLVAGYLLTASLSILASVSTSPFSRALTGFWYGDSFRMLAVMPVTVAPLAAAGAVYVFDRGSALVSRQAGQRGLPAWSTPLRARSATAVALVLLVALLQPNYLGLQGTKNLVGAAYHPGPGTRQLVDDDERALYERLDRYVPVGSRILGNPWTGAVLAGVLSGRELVWPYFVIGDDHQRGVLRDRLRELDTDPEVCESLRQLKVAVVITDLNIYWEGHGAEDFPGLEELDKVPGLQEIDRGGTATAYAITGCEGGMVPGDYLAGHPDSTKLGERTPAGG